MYKDQGRLSRTGTLSFKFTAITALVVTLTVAAIVALLTGFNGNTEKNIELNRQKVEEQSHQGMRSIARGVYNAVNAYNLQAISSLEGAVHYFEEIINLRGGIRWNAPLNYDVNTPSPIVDEVAKSQNVLATIFRKTDEQGTMMRIQTSIIQDGKRYVNTRINPRNEDGSQNEIIASVLQGKTYTGRALVGNIWISSVYKPIMENGNVTGMLFVGLLPEKMQNFINSIRDIRYGKEGKSFALGANGQQKGFFAISMNGIRDGQDVWNEQNSRGDYYMQQLIDFGKSLPGDSVEITEILYRNGRGEEQELYAALVYFEPWDWVIGVSIPKAELEQVSEEMKASLTGSIETLMRSVFLTAVIALLIAITAIYLTTKKLLNPLLTSIKAFKEIAGGNMTKRVEAKSRDEVGEMAKNFNTLMDTLHDFMKNVAKNVSALAGSAEELSGVSRVLASASEQTVQQSSDMKNATELVSENIHAMASGAEEAGVNANEVAGAAEEMSVNMNTIASAVKEMSASITEIADNAGEASQIAAEASKKAGNATSVMGKLGTAAKEIGQVTDLIKSIADKTNLLALNATIEAASAGEAGKGFAVVAGEIKELANQSAKSADDISRRIESIQEETTTAVDVIHEVSDIIKKINESVEAIAGHVSEQTNASNEIANNVAQASIGAKRVASAIGEVAKGANDVSRNAGEAAKGANDVSGNVVSLRNVAKDSAQGAEKVNSHADDLSRMANNLKTVVDRFNI